MRARVEGRAANRICRCPSTLSSFLAFVSQVRWDLRQTQRLLGPQLYRRSRADLRSPTCSQGDRGLATATSHRLNGPEGSRS